MNRLIAILTVVLCIIAGNAFAGNPVDAATDKLQVDMVKLKADLASNKDKAILDADKVKIKNDKAALKAARRSAKKQPWLQSSPS